MKALITLLIPTVITFATGDPPKDNSTEIISLEKVPIIVANLNGKSAYFVLDSGSDVSLLHLEDAEKFQYTHQKRAAKSIVGASGGKQALFEASQVALQIGQQSLQTVYYATDLSSVIESLSNSTGVTISGIIGMDLMRKYGFEIDYINRQLVLHWDL